VTTYAGSPGSGSCSGGTGSSARFNAPSGLAADLFGNIMLQTVSAIQLERLTILDLSQKLVVAAVKLCFHVQTEL
jgi:hypothetical protein